MHHFLHNIAKKEEIDAPSFKFLLADGHLLIYVADAVSPFIRYLWEKLSFPRLWIVSLFANLSGSKTLLKLINVLRLKVGLFFKH